MSEPREPASFLPSEVLRVGGRYGLVEVIGVGGMATVWRAVQHGSAGFSREVALKKMRPEFAALQHYLAMFLEESRVGSELQHPNLVQVYDLCEDDEGALYLVMEWVRGLDLNSFVRSFEEGRTPWALVVAIGVGALRGLAAAHERRTRDGQRSPIIHRDVSPHNLLLGLDGVVKLGDFGCAFARDRLNRLTGPGIVKGKLRYLPPEAARCEAPTVAGDVFSMGAVLWEALVGRQLFEGADLDVFRMLAAGQIARLDERRTDLPPELVRVVHRALAFHPQDRYETAREMAHELAHLLRGVVSRSDAQSHLRREVEAARLRLGVVARSQPVELAGVEGSEICEISLADLQVVDHPRDLTVTPPPLPLPADDH